MTAVVPARRVDHHPLAAGEFKFWRQPEAASEGGLHFKCPCGCGALLGVSFGPNGWTWDGNRDKPTVTPSIRDMAGCLWHGFLTAGEFITA
jgi:hypothetical protein